MAARVWLMIGLWGVGVAFCAAPEGRAGKAATAREVNVTIMGLPVNSLSAAGMRAEQLVFVNAKDWQQFWKAHSQAPAPAVDFSRWQIAAALLGPKPNPGYGVRIVRGRRGDGGITLTTEEWLPDPKMMYAQVIVYPFDVVAAPAGLTVQFAREERPRPKPAPAAQTEYRVLNTAGMTAPKGAEYVLFTDAKAWRDFWSAHSEAAVPEVDFGRNLVAGLVQTTTQVTIASAAVQKTGDEVWVRMCRGSAGDAGEGRKSVLVAAPKAARVNFGWLESLL